MPDQSRDKVGGKLASPGPYLAKVVSHLDPTYMGNLQVELLHYSGNKDSRETNLHQVSYISPFLGQTSKDHISETDDYNNTQKSYGMWMIPPDPGNVVVVIFIDGDPGQGYWFGCIQDREMNFQVPGYAATQYHVDGKKKRVPVAEYNKKARTDAVPDSTKNKKPASPLEKVLTDQGTIEDDVRGITTSSARREIPSAVFGISTPGPIDKKGKKSKVGKHENKIADAFVSRLGGSSFVMDDGDDKWERKTTPSEGPPEYVSVEDGQTGLRDRPHNELIRLRTRTGHQILLHNSEDLIYIGNARGTAWIELTSDGKMDVYCEDSISFRTKKDFNFYADRDFNLEVGRNFNIKVGKEMHTQVLADQVLIVNANQKIHVKAKKDETVDSNSTYKVGGNYDTNVGGRIWETSGGSNETRAGGNIIETAPQIHMNGPAAGTATTAVKPDPLKTHKLPDLSKPGADPSDVSRIVRRMPTPEPYPHHENLDPQKFKPAKTDRDADGRVNGESGSIRPNGQYWKKYTTSTDTFAKVGK